MKAYKIIYGKNGDTHELYISGFSDAKALYLNYKKYYMSIKDIASYTENRSFKGKFKDFWSFSAIIDSNKWEVSIVPIEID